MEFKTLKPIFKHLFNFLALSLLSFTAVANVVLVDGHVRAMPASVPNTAAYLTLENNGDKTVNLIAIKTPIAKEAQLHTIIEENGMVKMRQIEHLPIASHGTLSLKPSGDHIMILGLNKPLAENDKVVLTLIFDNKQRLQVELPVLKQADSEHQDHSEHHHHH
ncbi:copper chaperone PCu(A)C [Shewanella sp. OMA3-2]|uniref:copper chaperone PCu(A)C n=1 Tax=Shewanella sp. OMA3-2 TaxID=2908650 RepID=UPI001F4150AB|nr:copper chaperone PCu(A)C [Shewanella sp. OMA3-2]UJF22754.1 copper chaperone PCu(A)C [Shewanella sp. OMA3-2]